VAINKADCIQIRPRLDVALPEYVVALINQPSIERLAQGLMLGQTRTRISMGRLRELRVPIAPIEAQEKFVKEVQEISRTNILVSESAELLQSAFSSLQQRAFSGQL
jgi:type I restriction enzyme S subunit